MTVLLEPPLVFFLLAGLGCAVLAVTGFLDAIRKFRRARRSEDDEAGSRAGLRFAGSLAVAGILAFVAFRLLSMVAAIAPQMARTLDLEGSAAPEMTYARFDVDGMPTEALAQLKGRVVLLNLWATWCPPCRQEMPELDRLQTDLGGRGLTIVHVSIENLETLQGWLAKNPMSTRHGRVDTLPIAVPALPTSLVIDREGVVRDILVGGKSYKAFEKAVTPWF